MISEAFYLRQIESARSVRGGGFSLTPIGGEQEEPLVKQENLVLLRIGEPGSATLF